MDEGELLLGVKDKIIPHVAWVSWTTALSRVLFSGNSFGKASSPISRALILGRGESIQFETINMSLHPCSVQYVCINF